MGQRRPGLLRAGFRRAGSSGTTPPPSGGGSVASFSYGLPYGSALSQTFSLSSGPALAIAQFSFDFSQISSTSLDLELGVRISCTNAGNGAVYGAFILGAGDPNLFQLFRVIFIEPDVQAIAPGVVGGYTNMTARATIANPGTVRQVLFASQIVSTGSQAPDPSTFLVRSIHLNAVGV